MIRRICFAKGGGQNRSKKLYNIFFVCALTQIFVYVLFDPPNHVPYDLLFTMFTKPFTTM